MIHAKAKTSHITADLEEFTILTLSNACECDRARVTPATDIADLGVDSFTLTVLAMHVEANYNCAFTPENMEDLFKCMLVREIVELIHQIVASPNPD
jgi:acyl carrier protein